MDQIDLDKYEWVANEYKIRNNFYGPDKETNRNHYIKLRSQLIEGPAKVPNGDKNTIKEFNKRGIIGLYRLKEEKANER
jgi:hypothetical protein